MIKLGLHLLSYCRETFRYESESELGGANKRHLETAEAVSSVHETCMNGKVIPPRDWSPISGNLIKLTWYCLGWPSGEE